MLTLDSLNDHAKNIKRPDEIFRVSSPSILESDNRVLFLGVVTGDPVELWRQPTSHQHMERRLDRSVSRTHGIDLNEGFLDKLDGLEKVLFLDDERRGETDTVIVVEAWRTFSIDGELSGSIRKQDLHVDVSRLGEKSEGVVNRSLVN